MEAVFPYGPPPAQLLLPCDPYYHYSFKFLHVNGIKENKRIKKKKLLKANIFFLAPCTDLVGRSGWVK